MVKIEEVTDDKRKVEIEFIVVDSNISNLGCHLAFSDGKAKIIKRLESSNIDNLSYVNSEIVEDKYILLDLRSDNKQL